MNSKLKGVAGVYQITNTVNGKIYIGSSINVYQRWYEHIKASSNIVLGRAIRKYGADRFVIEMLETLDISDLTQKESKDFLTYYEQHYLDKDISFVGSGDGYNVSKDATSVLGYKWTDNQLQKIEQKIDCYSTVGDFIKTYKSLAYVEENLGINHSKVSLCINGKRKTAGGFLWVKHKEAAPKPYVRTNLPKPVIMMTLEGEEINRFDSSWMAAKYLFPDLETTDKVIGKKAYSIQRVCNEIRGKYNGYKWKWV